MVENPDSKVIAVIVAVAENGGIGKDNDLLCHLPGDLKRFKELTSGHVVVMGRNTWLSLPNPPLPGRKNIVISDNKDDQFEGAVMVQSLQEAISQMSKDKINFIIGGGSVYRQMMPVANRFYLTRIHRSFDADTFFPDINWNEWKKMSEEQYDYPEISYTNYIYERQE